MCSQKVAMNTCLVTSALVANASAIIAQIAPTVNPTFRQQPNNKRAMQKHSSFYIFNKCAPEAVSKTETHPGVTQYVQPGERDRWNT